MGQHNVIGRHRHAEYAPAPLSHSTRRNRVVAFRPSYRSHRHSFERTRGPGRPQAGATAPRRLIHPCAHQSKAACARQTCALAALTPVAEIEPDLQEWDYGDYEGQRSVDIRKSRPNWNLFRDGGPRGETPGQVSDRADRLIARLRAMDGKVALFSHGHFGCVLAARWIGLPVIEGQHFLLGTASLSILDYEPRNPEVPVIVLGC